MAEYPYRSRDLLLTAASADPFGSFYVLSKSQDLDVETMVDSPFHEQDEWDADEKNEDIRSRRRQRW